MGFAWVILDATYTMPVFETWSFRIEIHWFMWERFVQAVIEMIDEKSRPILFDSAQIIFDTETNGVHASAKVLEIGAVVLDKFGRMVAEFQTLVHQPKSLLDAAISQGAKNVHNIETDDVLQFGLTEEAAGERFANWIENCKQEYGVSCIRAYNQRFDIGKVSTHPISLFNRVDIEFGDCIMLASMPPMISAGAAYRWPNQRRNANLDENDIRRYKWPKANEEAAPFFTSLGYILPHDVMHRALPDARKEAAIAVAIRSEQLLSQGKISERMHGND